MEIVNIVLPVFLVVGLGYFLGLWRFIDSAVNARLSKLVFYVAAPLLLFRSAAITPLGRSVNLPALGVMAAVTVVLGFVVYLFSGRCRPSRRGVLTQGTHRSNMVFVALPVIMNAYGDAVLGPAAVLISFMVVLYNFLAVLFLTLPLRDRSRALKADTLLKMLKNPLILSCGAGLLFSALGLPLPLCVDRSLDLVGRTAMPLALLCVGAGLDLSKVRAELWPACFTSLIKLVVYPGLVCAALMALDFSGIELYVPVLIMAAPTAVVSYIMAQEMGGDERLAAAIVIGTTLASPLTLSAWLAFFHYMG